MIVLPISVIISPVLIFFSYALDDLSIDVIIIPSPLSLDLTFKPSRSKLFDLEPEKIFTTSSWSGLRPKVTVIFFIYPSRIMPKFITSPGFALETLFLSSFTVSYTHLTLPTKRIV